MISIPFEVLEFTILPLVSAQIMVLVLLYFSMFSRHVLVGYYLHAIFLSSFAFYLVGQLLQFYSPLQTAICILFARGIFLFGIGIPSAIIMLCQMRGLVLSFRVKAALYAVSSFLYVIMIAIQDGVNYNYFFSAQFIASLPFLIVNSHALILLSMHMLLLMAPLLALFWQEWFGERKPMHIAFLLGVLSVPLVQLISHHIGNGYWLIYFAAVFTATCWAWAVFYDVRRAQGEAHVIKEELLWLLHRGVSQDQGRELIALWQRLAANSGSVERYKLQVRELLSRFADLSITAGADSRAMLERANASNEAIHKSVSAEEVQSIAAQESLVLSDLMADLPRQRRERVVAQAKYYITQNFSQVKDNQAVAKHCEVSQGYLMRSFKDETGKTLNQFLTELRIQEAKKLLVYRSVTDTAFDVGFNSSNYFSTVFKKVTGQSPVQFKQDLLP